LPTLNHASPTLKKLARALGVPMTELLGVSYYILRVASRREERLGQQALRETIRHLCRPGAGFPSAQPDERVLHAALLGNSSRHTRTALT
jgi:hypothetical protein